MVFKGLNDAYIYEEFIKSNVDITHSNGSNTNIKSRTFQFF